MKCSKSHTSEHFDFLVVVGVRGGDFFGAGIGKEAQADGDVVALLFIALEDEGEVMLAETLAGDPDAGVVLFCFGESGGGEGAFDDVIGIRLFRIGGLEEVDHIAGGDSGGSGSELPVGGPGDFLGVFSEFF